MRREKISFRENNRFNLKEYRLRETECVSDKKKGRGVVIFLRDQRRNSFGEKE